nr:MAG TPA: hypothetical protein [Caudoviricetes sp.]
MWIDYGLIKVWRGQIRDGQVHAKKVSNIKRFKS